MAGYEVVIEALREAGQAAGGASDTIGGVNAADSLPTGEAGMPGGRVVGKINAVRAAWQDRTRGLTTGFTEVSDAFSQAVQLYRTNEHAAQADLREATNSAGGRRPV
ncbi:type VII secretion target [Amycolatopsis nigrescens]|uniref:type VII secretion target n=1 Tax=Amycolatopsis nigrescens TaxID=381445 RepID=UPI00035C2454|nr:hypothetical protein [Amycolatopsis nigrescens]